jgi:hypothetical protein
MKHPSFTHILTARFYGPTNTKGARVKISMPSRNLALWVPYSYEHGGNTALVFLHSRNIQPAFEADGNGEAIFVLSSEDFTAAWALFSK